MLVPQALLACSASAGSVPGRGARRAQRCVASLPGLQPRADGWGPVGDDVARGSFDAWCPWCSASRCSGAGGRGRARCAAACAAARADVGLRRRAAARTEYTATAFSKPLMMIFRAIYRPTRQVEALAEVSPYFPARCVIASEIEPTFERYVYGPLLRGVLRAANGMKVLQAGSLHAYLAYVLVLGVLLLLWLGGTT